MGRIPQGVGSAPGHVVHECCYRDDRPWWKLPIYERTSTRQKGSSRLKVFLFRVWVGRVGIRDTELCPGRVSSTS